MQDQAFPCFDLVCSYENPLVGGLLRYGCLSKLSFDSYADSIRCYDLKCERRISSRVSSVIRSLSSSHRDLFEAAARPVAQGKAQNLSCMDGLSCGMDEQKNGMTSKDWRQTGREQTTSPCSSLRIYARSDRGVIAAGTVEIPHRKAQDQVRAIASKLVRRKITVFFRPAPTDSIQVRSRFGRVKVPAYE